jgi:nitrite reductase/ring-hydroxylating ferredoxin subunit
MGFVNVAKAGEIAPGAMKHVGIGETEICIVNVEGTFYAIGDWCGHENARMSRGLPDGNNRYLPHAFLAV